MTQAKIAKKQPAKVELKENQTIYWCACGRSENQPFCDGSHVVTDIVPIKYKAEKDETVFLCQCKQTSTPPFCDGTHNKL
jgi:CDGSH-type Zn-finger protein